jgi:histidinol phosphatase-like PHP family hydrolase
VTLTCDWHIHTRNSCDQASLEVAHLVEAAAHLGVRDYGIADHLHTPYNLPDLEASRREYLSVNPSPRFHFGVEVSCVSVWELEEVAKGTYPNPVYGIRTGGPPGAALAIGLAPQEKVRLGIEYVVGGTHWPMYVPAERDAVIRDYHRQNLFLATHPLVDIVAHPWWWMGSWKDPDGCYRGDPWLDDFGKIPAAMHDEFAAAAVQHGTAVEINLGATLLNRAYPPSFGEQYAEYLAYLKSRGVCLTLGSDCHAPHYAPDFARAARLLEAVGIRDHELWRLPPRAPTA